METALAIGAETQLYASQFHRHTQQLPLPFEQQSPIETPTDKRDIAQRSTSFVRALIEVLAGQRSVLQMTTWVTPDVYEGLVRQVTLNSRINPEPHDQPRLASLHIFAPHQHAAEINCRVEVGERSRAIALRLDLLIDVRGRWRWRCTALELG